MSSDRLPSSPPPRRSSGFWAFDPLTDLAFVLLTPAAILLAFAAARAGGWVDGLLAVGLSLAVAHYLPGMLRAYGDRALFRRFRARLILAPLILFSITLGFAYLDLHIVVLLAVLWGSWHWMMQIYGFARIYDARAEPDARTPGWLDWATCLLWFGMCVFVLNNDWPAYLTRFYQSGGPLVPAGFFIGFERAWLALTVAVTLFYAIRTIAFLRHGRRPNPVKLGFIAATFVYLSYTVSVVERPLMALVLFEAWHDVQYLAIVWAFNVKRAARTPDAGAFLRFLFRPRALLALAYVALCLAFGLLAHASSLFESETAARLVAGGILSIAMLHYYLDGFIWKIREQEIGQALDIRMETPQPLPPTVAPAVFPVWARHAALWLLFVVPAGLFFVIESRGDAPGALRIRQSIVATFPDSAPARYELGRELMDAGRRREARAEFERAVALRPELLPARLHLGALLANDGDMAGARPHFERVLELDPQNAQALNNLGIVLEALGELAEARRRLERAVQLQPEYALAHHNLGVVLDKLGEPDPARAHQAEAIRLAPDFANAHYRLGLLLKEAGDWTGAVAAFTEAVRLDPGRPDVHNELGVTLLSQGRPAEAREYFQRALQLRPDDLEVQENLARISGDLESTNH